MRKYIGTYRVFPEVDLITGKPVDDLYLKGRNNIRVFRHNDNELGILFLSSRTANSVIADFKKLKVKLTKVSEGDWESIYIFKEKDINDVASILKLQIKNRNIDPMDSKNRLPKAKRIKL